MLEERRLGRLFLFLQTHHNTVAGATTMSRTTGTEHELRSKMETHISSPLRRRGEGSTEASQLPKQHPMWLGRRM